MEKYFFIFISISFLIVAAKTNSQYKGGSYDGYYSVIDTSIPYPVGIIKLEEIAGDYKLFQNYPNPFNPVTNINFSIYKNSNVSLKIYDINGRVVKVLLNDIKMNSGTYSVSFDGKNLSSGIYFYKIEINGNFTDTKKMILNK